MKTPQLRRWLGLLLFTGIFLTAAWHVYSHRRAPAGAETVELHVGHWLLHAGMREAFDDAIAGYQRLHPHVVIRQIPVPVRSYEAWARTQLIGGTAPDITGMLRLNEELISRHFLPLTPHLDRPNPYNAGTPLENVPWRDTFVDGLTAMRNLTPTSGEIHGVSLQVNTQRLYYNRELLRAITGSDTPPADFAGLLAFGRQVAAYNERTGAQLVPIAGCGPYSQFLFDLLLPSQTQRLVLTASPNRNLRVLPVELAGLILQGRVDYDTPALRRSLELLHDMAGLLTPGYQQLQRDDAIFTYLQQNSVMLYAGSWDYAVLLRDGAFTTGILPMPAPAADDPVYGPLTLGPISEAAGNPEAMLGVLRSSRHREVALDFLHYLSSRAATAEFSRISHRISSVIGTPPPPDGSLLVPRLEGELSGFTVDFRWFAAGSASNFFQRHLHGSIGPRGDVAAFAARLNAEMPRYLRQDLAWHLQQLRRDVQRLDAMAALQLTLAPDDAAREGWTRHAEMQHTRQLENLHYRPLAEAP
jgi:ABC-type glycerol-3-phosphate transport system substrate-binding protein